ncbi:hypothetical protein ACE38V_09130 [Cytobacillus sp. Hz8]|uniref:hypothetical protein n=1 Tax=Cytobacillus sp. Hz8 TaxID=3347168 RepID=UPI0035DF2EB1
MNAILSNRINMLIDGENRLLLKKSSYLNLPDLRFYQWLNHLYNINKGVFNTIDQWFYENGFENIYCRRIYILSFLEYVQKEEMVKKKGKYVRFGHGGLICQLRRFCESLA